MELLKAVGTVTAASVILTQKLKAESFNDDFTGDAQEATSTAVKSMLSWEKAVRLLENTIEAPGDAEGWIQRNLGRSQCIRIVKELLKEVTDE